MRGAAWRASIRGAAQRFAAWLIKIAVHLCRDLQRRRGRRPEEAAAEILGSSSALEPSAPGHGEPSRLGAQREAERHAAHAIAEIPGSVLVTVPTGDMNKLRECAAASIQGGAARLNVQVSASASDEPLSQVGGLCLRSGRTAALSAGSERLIANEDDVEVAQFAACHDPTIATHFEGLRASISLIQLSGGRLAYSIKGSLSTDVDEDDLEFFGTEGLTALTSEVLILNDRGTKAEDADGGWTILLGDESGQGQRVQLKVHLVK